MSANAIYCESGYTHSHADPPQEFQPLTSISLVRAALAASALLLTFSSPAHAQLGGGDYMTASLKLPAKFTVGKAAEVVVVLSIDEGYHVQSNAAKDPYIPTKVTLTGPKGAKIGKPLFPPSITASVAGDTIPVFEGTVEVKVPVTFAKVPAGPLKFNVKVEYQACTDKACFPPAEATASATIGPKKSEAAPPSAGPGGFGGNGGYVTLSASLPKVSGGTPFEVEVTLKVKAGHHIQSNNPAKDFIPTELVVTMPPGFKAGTPRFPPHVMAKVGSSTIPVFEGDVRVTVPVTPPAVVTSQPEIKLTLSYQACDDRVCFAPEEASLSVSSAGVSQANGSGQASTPNAITEGVPGFTLTKIAQFVPPAEFIKFLKTGSIAKDAGVGKLEKALSGGNLALALPLIFLLGLALNLTPCVYPIIPITISYFGGQAQQTGRKPIVLAIFYVLGMALMYSALGVAAGLTGDLFGKQLQNPVVLGVFAAVMFALALSQFDRKNGMPIWEFQLPAGLRNKAQSKSGIGGAMFMGLMVGVVAAPCIGPAVIALLQWVGTQKNALLGFVVFFTLAVGLGLPYIFLAMASGSVKKLPRSGEWMIAVKHIFGVIMIWMGVYYLGTVLNLIHPSAGKIALVATTALGGLYLLAFDKAGARAPKFFAFKRVLGLAGIGLALFISKPAPPETIQWKPYSETALDEARSAGKKVVIDFSADWCAQCKELEHITFADKAVGAEAADYVALRADMTKFDGPNGKKWQAQYGIKGLPTVVRLVPSG